jgi:hypothetical protein
MRRHAEPLLPLLVEPLVEQVQRGVDAVGIGRRRPRPLLGTRTFAEDTYAFGDVVEELSYLGASDAVGIAVTDDRHNHSADDALELPSRARPPVLRFTRKEPQLGCHPNRSCAFPACFLGRESLGLPHRDGVDALRHVRQQHSRLLTRIREREQTDVADVKPPWLARETIAEAIRASAVGRDTQHEAPQDGVVILRLTSTRRKRGDALVRQVLPKPAETPYKSVDVVSDDTLMTRQP